jgi:hypothetical protein
MLVRIAPAPVAHSGELARRILELLCKMGGSAQDHGQPSHRNRSALRGPGNCRNLLDFEVVVLFTQKRG